MVAQPNARIPDQIWRLADEKILRLRRPEISATAIWERALERLVREPDRETRRRYRDTPTAPRGRGVPSTKHNARIDAEVWRRAQAKILRLRSDSNAPIEITATSEWIRALDEFIVESDPATLHAHGLIALPETTS